MAVLYYKILPIFVSLLLKESSADLYFKNDPVVLLNSTNFHDVILRKSNAWIIEFYASWCGHCIKFSPIWKQFANEVRDWHPTVKAAVLDCADVENAGLCRDYEVSTYPTIRLFGQNVQMNDIGLPVSERTSKTMQRRVINFIEDYQRKKLGSPKWANLLNYRGPLSKIFDEAPQESEKGIIIVEEPNSIIGRQVILDLGIYKQAYVRRMMLKDLESEHKDGINSPAVFVVDRQGSIEQLMEAGTTREEITAFLILKYDLNKKHKMTTKQPTTVPTTTSSSVVRTDVVYMADIEKALHYAISHEMIRKTIIEGETLTALKDFIDVLIKYLPARPYVLEALKEIGDFLKLSGDSLKGEEFESKIKEMESNGSFISNQMPWKGCLGSHPKYRGYPCGLWVLFHTLTVNAANKEQENEKYDPKDVLRPIHGFVKYIFGCDYCSNHFQEMYSVDAETYAKKANDEAMWFWKAHNKVNKRLKGELSEDPKYPKKQFPSKSSCPECWKDENSFNEAEVLKFLKKIYSGPAISHEGLNDTSKTNDSIMNQGNVSHVISGLSLIAMSSLY